MVDRYAIGLSSDQLSDTLTLSVKEKFSSSFNCAPSKYLPVSTGQNPKTVQLFRWGLISGFSNNKVLSPKLFNSDFHEILNKPSGRKNLQSNRCIIYATGFYLWKPITKKKSSPYYFSIPNAEIIFIAGVWEEGESISGEKENTFVMVTAPSPSKYSEFQENLPLILNSDMGSSWMNSETSLDQLALTYTDQFEKFEMSSHPVSPAIQEIKNDDHKLILPIKATDQYGNYTLFG